MKIRFKSEVSSVYRCEYVDDEMRFLNLGLKRTKSAIKLVLQLCATFQTDPRFI